MSLIYKKTAAVLSFDKEKPVTYYKLQQMKQSKVTYDQLKRDVLRASGLSKTQTQAFVAALAMATVVGEQHVDLSIKTEYE